jgi:hypothetical protein
MDWPPACLERCRKTGAILDTNVLVAWWIAVVLGVEHLERISRVAEWEPADIDRLQKLLCLACKVVVTPGVLAEACNILDKENRRHDEKLFNFMRLTLEQWEEQYIPAKELTKGPVFATLGAADAAVYDVAARGYLVVTGDARLAAWIENDGFSVLNINHLRSADWLATS